MLTNAAQMDECWEKPVQPRMVRPYMQANGNLRPLAAEQGRAINAVESVVLDILGIEIKWTPDGRPFPPTVLEAIKQLYAIYGLEDGWDSYGGKKLDLAVVEPTLKLIFAGHQRGYCHRLIPLSDGGVGLRWEANGKEIEIDVSVGGAFEITVEDLASGDISEPRAGNPAEVHRILELVL